MTKMFLVVLVSFVLLMSPHRWLMFLSGIQYKLSGGADTKGWSLLYQDAMVGVFSLLYLCNSIVDPLVYNIMAKRFRSLPITIPYDSTTHRHYFFDRIQYVCGLKYMSNWARRLTSFYCKTVTFFTSKKKHP